MVVGEAPPSPDAGVTTSTSPALGRETSSRPSGVQASSRAPSTRAKTLTVQPAGAWTVRGSSSGEPARSAGTTRSTVPSGAEPGAAVVGGALDGVAAGAGAAPGGHQQQTGDGQGREVSDGSAEAHAPRVPTRRKPRSLAAPSQPQPASGRRRQPVDRVREVVADVERAVRALHRGHRAGPSGCRPALWNPDMIVCWPPRPPSDRREEGDLRRARRGAVPGTVHPDQRAVAARPGQRRAGEGEPERGRVRRQPLLDRGERRAVELRRRRG